MKKELIDKIQEALNKVNEEMKTEEFIITKCYLEGCKDTLNNIMNYLKQK